MHIDINHFDSDTSGEGAVSWPGGQRSKIYVLSSEPKEQKSFAGGTRSGRSVTGVTGQSFMCKTLMCLVWLLTLVLHLEGESTRAAPSGACKCQ